MKVASSILPLRQILPVVLLMIFGLTLNGCGSSDGSGVISGANSLQQTSSTDARYRVTFEATWSEATHPELPSGAHFSPLIGVAHNDQVVVWATGEPASNGIEAMAETGATGPLAGEARTLMAMGNADPILSGGGVNSPGTVSFEFEISTRFPRVSLVSMIAPSPDWFVGVRDLNLYPNSLWLQTTTVDLFAYDAGTDSGASFTAANADTQPPENIFERQTGPFFVNNAVPRLGTFTFTRIDNAR